MIEEEKFYETLILLEFERSYELLRHSWQVMTEALLVFLLILKAKYLFISILNSTTLKRNLANSLYKNVLEVKNFLIYIFLGGGAIEMELSKILREYSRTIAGKEQLLIAAIAKALEIIPRQLCDNAGFDATNILNKLRQKHAQGGQWFGVDITKEHIADNFDQCVWEPSIIKINALTAAAEAACMILSVDETIKSPNAGNQQMPMAGGMGRGMGRPM
ncbi:T-complex protein 1 subunit eta-like [Bactrocera tryoni]|uniref:T-complex protein 1 subunit eta-like n=1 Tax=Bactrocera tryoni TaxID=59916 RepID=UPI001A95CDAA|nr:T-complex protein 1 subunit eta-like [Bactrocera tryoni]